MAKAATIERSTKKGSRNGLLGKITSSTRNRPGLVVVHGVEGIGKTSLAAHAPGCVFIMPTGETGLETLIDAGRVPATAHFPELHTWADVLQACESLEDGQHDHRTLVIDTLNALERLCHEYVCEQHYGGDWGRTGFANYQQGFETSLAEWRRLLAVFDRLRDRGMAILLLAHTVIRSHRNPDGADWDRFVPDLHHKTWAITNRAADVVLFANFADLVFEDGSRMKAKGSDQDRILHTVRTAAWDAKNRHGLADEIEMGSTAAEAWQAFADAMKNSKKPAGKAGA